MQLDFAFVADFAQVAGGKVNVIGGAFDRIWAKEVPLVHPLMTLVMRFIVTPAEVGRAHKLEVIVVDEDGQKITSISGDLTVEKVGPAKSWEPVTPVLAWNIMNARFEKFGTYAIEILVNGTSMKSLPLHIAPRREQPVGAV